MFDFAIVDFCQNSLHHIRIGRFGPSFIQIATKNKLKLKQPMRKLPMEQYFATIS